MSGLKLVLHRELEALEEGRKELLQRLSELGAKMENPTLDDAERAGNCSRCQPDMQGPSCAHCEGEELFQVIRSRNCTYCWAFAFQLGSNGSLCFFDCTTFWTAQGARPRYDFGGGRNQFGVLDIRIVFQRFRPARQLKGEWTGLQYFSERRLYTFWFSWG